MQLHFRLNLTVKLASGVALVQARVSVRASNRNSEDPGSNPGWISMFFFLFLPSFNSANRNTPFNLIMGCFHAVALHSWIISSTCQLNTENHFGC